MRPSLFCLVLLVGCTIVETPLGGRDAGTTRDDASAEAGPRDAQATLDADAPLDGGAPRDAGRDAATRDAGRDAGPPPLCDGHPDLVACHAFEDDLEDGSAHDNDVRDDSSSARFVTGAVGRALDHASGDAYWIPHDGSLDLASLTLEVWVRPDTLPGSGRAGILDRNGDFGLFVYAPAEMRCSVGSGVWLSDRTPVEAGRWTHYACTWDGSTARLFRDGALAAETPVTRVRPSSPGEVRIGANSPSGDDFDGQLDELRIWRVARGAAELSAAAARR